MLFARNRILCVVRFVASDSQRYPTATDRITVSWYIPHPLLQSACSPYTLFMPPCVCLAILKTVPQQTSLVKTITYHKCVYVIIWMLFFWSPQIFAHGPTLVLSVHVYYFMVKSLVYFKIKNKIFRTIWNKFSTACVRLFLGLLIATSHPARWLDFCLFDCMPAVSSPTLYYQLIWYKTYRYSFSGIYPMATLA